MSDTLAFLIDAPLQSWGASSKFQRRETESWPTKSALVGVLAAALGIDKHAPDEVVRIAPLAGLCFSVFRWHKPAPVTRLTDFHTIGGGYDKTNPAEKLHIPRKALAALLQKLGNDPAELPALEGMTESRGEGRFYQADQPVAFGQHHGAIPVAYLSRPVRRLAPGEMP